MEARFGFGERFGFNATSPFSSPAGGGGGVPRDGLALEYLLNGNTLDTSGNNYHGTNNGLAFTTGMK